jgi:aminocarboxymuconate-semialdehyde decarboxylase
MKIDVFNHVLPPPLLERLATIMPGPPVQRWRTIKTLYDVEARVRMLDEFGDYRQVLSLGQPPLDEVAGPDQTPDLARIGNDGMAAMCRARPDRFPGFIASLPMNNPDAAVKEIDRAVRDLGALGVQVHTNVGGKALDQPEFFPVFDRMRQLGKPIWLHPGRPMNHPDYLAEDYSMYEIWWGLGWAYETSAAMARLVFSGMLDKLPGIKIIAHHWGAYIPHAEGRIPHWEGRSSQSTEHVYGPLKEKLKRPAMQYFKEFYGDTAMFGARAASQAGLEFFGAGHSVFATDCPYDREGGRLFIRDTIQVLNSLRCTAAEREQIYRGNAEALLGLR